jgi:alkanesulfonate monooxygenase SsuD/methylene tetrahydromethanopterin reductase-like flavin-dependent oxidoreductase (luciferase family)
VIRVGLDVHDSILGLPPEASRLLIRRVADSELDFVVVGDHVSFRGGQGFDGIVSATLALSAHPTLPVLIAVYQLALRHPLVVARQLSSIAQVAPGRLVLGVGVGGEDRHEVVNSGVDPSTRGRRLDEAIQVLRLLASGEQVTHAGGFFHLQEALVLPVPSPPVPIVVGGSSEAALKRVALLGDGWLPMFVSPRRFRESVGQIAEMAASAHRRLPLGPTLNVWCGLDADPGRARTLLGQALEQLYALPYEKFRNLTFAGSPGDVAESLFRYVEAGCRDFSLLVVAQTWEAGIDLAAEVRHHLLKSAGPVRPQSSRGALLDSRH